MDRSMGVGAKQTTFGTLERIMGGLTMEGQLTKGFNAILKILDAASRHCSEVGQSIGCPLMGR